MALVQVGSRPSDCQGLRKTARGRASRKGSSSFCAQSASSVHRLSGTVSEPKFTPPPLSGQIGGSLQFLARPLIGCAPHPSSTQDDQRHFNSLLREGLYPFVISQMQSIAHLSADPTTSSMSHQSIRHRRIASDVGISDLPCFVQIWVHSRSAGSTSGRDVHRRRLPRPVASSEFWGLLRFGRKHI